MKIFEMSSVAEQKLSVINASADLCRKKTKKDLVCDWVLYTFSSLYCFQFFHFFSVFPMGVVVIVLTPLLILLLSTYIKRRKYSSVFM